MLERLVDDMTEQAGSNRERNDAPEEEKLVKWQLPGNLDIAAAKRQLSRLLATLLIAFPDRITIIDRKQQEWAYQETMEEETFTKTAEAMALQLHPIKNKQQKVIRWVAITKARATTTIQDWKNDEEFYNQAKEMKAYAFPHPFGPDDWDVVSIGFIKDHHAVHYPKEFLKEKIGMLLTEQTRNPPTFQLIPQRIASKDNKATTKAYTIQCLKSSSDQLIHLLTHGSFRQAPHQVFVPFKYKTIQPELFLQCIRQQNDVYHKTWIIKMEGITQEAMDIMAPEISKIKGVFHIVPSKRAKTIGEWKVLVDQNKCSYIHRILVKQWNELMSLVPPEIQANAPAGFPTPAVSSRKVREYQDDNSDIDSYGSLLSVGTDASQMTTDETVLDNLPDSYQYPSYAAAAAAAVATESNSSTASTQISSPTTSAYLDWHKEKQELETQLQRQATLIEQIQSDLQEKISRSKDLEEKLAQALDLACDRDARHEEMMNKFDMLLKMQQGNRNDGTTFETLPSTPVRANSSPASPPSKRKNTNATPHRNMYSIFRPNQGSSPTERSRPTRPQSDLNKKLPPTTEATMDIDEEPTTPPPAAESGNRKE